MSTLLLLLTFLVFAVAHTPARERLWLRYDLIPDPSLYTSIHLVLVQGHAENCQDSTQLAALHGLAQELTDGLSGLLGRTIPNQVNCLSQVSQSSNALLVSVAVDGNGNGQQKDSSEGFTLTGSPHFTIVANTPSGLLYGAFRFLSFLQQHRTIPATYTSAPAMKLRAWDLWDTVSGSVEQGHDGNSLFWPYAIYNKDSPPELDCPCPQSSCPRFFEETWCPRLI